MKKTGIIAAVTLLLTAVFGAGAAYAHDAEYGMWNGEQNGLLLGEVEEAGGDWVILKDVRALPSGDEGGVLDRQLPPEDVPKRLKVTELRPYLISYSGAEQPQAGHYLLVSADLEENGDWKALWSPYEVSSLDPSTLEFQPEGQKTIQGFAWEWFVHSGGAEHDFAFEYGDVQTLYIRRVQADGSKKNEVLFQVDTTKPEADGNESGTVGDGADTGVGAAASGTDTSEGAADDTPAAVAQPGSSTVTSTGLAVGLIAAAAGFLGGTAISKRFKKKR